MSKSTRFFSHLWKCFVSGEHGFFRLWRLVGLLGSGILITVPGFTAALSNYAVWFREIGMLLLFVLALWTSFTLYDDLKEKAKPRLKVAIGVPVPNDRQPNVLFPLDVTNVSLSDVEHCRGSVVRVAHNRRQLWGDRREPLRFARAGDPDSTDKKISPGTTEHLDVVFVRFRGSDVVLGVDEAKWEHQETFEKIFFEHGDYFLTVQITAKGAPTIEVVLKFHWAGEASNLELVSQRVLMGD